MVQGSRQYAFNTAEYRGTRRSQPRRSTPPHPKQSVRVNERELSTPLNEGAVLPSGSGALPSASMPPAPRPDQVLCASSAVRPGRDA